MSVPEHLSEQLIKYFFTDEASATRPAAWKVALHAGNPGAGDDNEVTEGAYAQVAATFASSDAGDYWEAANEADVTFPAAGVGASYTVTHFTVRDSATDACLAIGQLPVPIPVVESGVVSFAAGDLKVRGNV